MGCGCGGNSGKIFLVTLPDGSKHQSASEVDARMLISQAGGGVWTELPSGNVPDDVVSDAGSTAGD
jgi:hypothetical protein